MNKKITATLICASFLALFAISSVSAEFWACFNKGQKIDYCNPKIPDRICDSNLGCRYCMADTSTSTCYSVGNWMVCNSLPDTCASNSTGGANAIPLEFDVNEPDNGKVYSTRSVVFDLQTNKKATYYYIDNLDGRGRWKRICASCTSFERGVSFSDGLNNLTIKAVASNGEELSETRSFYVDSKKPKISKTEPSKGFANGEFFVQFTEANPKELILNYGNSLKGVKTKTIDLTKCASEKGKTYCDTSVDLKNYDGTQITYWFKLTDIADVAAESKQIALEVDTTAPVIKYFNYTLDSRYTKFFFEIEEKNFDEIIYIDNSERNPRWLRLCSRLKEGTCEIKKSFRTGLHDIDIQVMDDAGNFVAKHISFDTGI